MSEIETATIISKDEIIRCYKSGMSQKEIRQAYGLSNMKVRAVLVEAGFETSRFRAIDARARQIIVTLIKAGYTYRKIEEICDFSIHAIRQISIDEGLQGVCKKTRSTKGRPQTKRPLSAKHPFISAYRSGQSFCSLCITFEYRNAAIFSAINSITEQDLEIHRENLRELIVKDASSGMSAIAIANRQVISKSTVTKYLS